MGWTPCLPSSVSAHVELVSSLSTHGCCIGGSMVAAFMMEDARSLAGARTRRLGIYLSPVVREAWRSSAGHDHQTPCMHGACTHVCTCMLRTSKVPQATKKAMRATRSAAP